MTQRAQKWLFAISLFFGVQAVYVLVVNNFGGYNDDFGDLVARLATPITLHNIVHDGCVNNYGSPVEGSYNFITNQPTKINQTSFLSAYYRPIGLLAQQLSFRVLGADFLAHYRFNVFLHAINTVLVFLLALLFGSPVIAGIFALFFAFHPTHGFCFGHAAQLQYYIFILFFVLMLLFLVRFMQTGFWLRYLPASWLLFLLALGCRESALAAPGAVGLFLLILFYGKNDWQKRLAIVFASLCMLNALTLGWRLYLYPLVFDSTAATLQIKALLTKYILTLHACAYDVLSVCDIAHGTHSIKYPYLLILSGLLLYAWLVTKKKLAVVALGVATFFLLVPSLATGYNQRHFYDALPLLTCFFVLLAQAVAVNSSIFIKRLLAAVLVCILAAKIAVCLLNVQTRAHYSKSVELAIKKVAAIPEVRLAKNVCVLAYPFIRSYRCMDLALPFYTKNLTQQVLLDRQCGIGCFTEMLEVDIGILRRPIPESVRGNMYHIKRIGNNVFYTFYKPLRADLMEYVEGATGHPDIRLGNWQLVHEDANSKQYQLTLRPELIAKTPLFIAWNPVCCQFELLAQEPE